MTEVEDMSCEESDCMDNLQNIGQGEVEESLLLLANVALAPPCGDEAACGCDYDAYSSVVEGSLQSMQIQLQFLMSKADDLQECVVSRLGHLEGEALAAAVPEFIYTCQPFFNHVESTARCTVSQLTLPYDMHAQLLDLSQQLCDRLQQLVITYASYNVLCLDEREPNSVSHFCIGQIHLGRLRLTTFLYCKPTPYLAWVDTGIYKRMRWNVDRLGDEQQQQADLEQGGESEAGTVGDTEFYFLCCEEIPITEADERSQDVSHCSVVRLWSIGQWMQVKPDPGTEDIYDWILCDTPQASYKRLLSLGSDEPSSCNATDFLQQLLLSQQTTE
ncbi:UPF0575 protein C19orf67 homolog [Pagrus major]|uniref:UPF0575 protein C19orf67 homolog n=1 Tax=Pagrus major TaxID=143350 RepID=UPI003CC8DE71